MCTVRNNVQDLEQTKASDIVIKYAVSEIIARFR